LATDRIRRAAAIAGLTSFACIFASCGRPAAPQASGSSPASPIQVKPSQHMAWDQAAPSLSWINSFTFVAYVDGQPQTLADASCKPAGPQLTCLAGIPKMSPGSTHRVEIAARDTFGRESDRSGSLYLVLAEPSR